MRKEPAICTSLFSTKQLFVKYFSNRSSKQRQNKQRNETICNSFSLGLNKFECDTDGCKGGFTFSYKLRKWYTSNLLIKSTKNGIFCKISKEWRRKRSSFKNPLASWDFSSTGFWGYIWSYYRNSLRIRGRRLVSILLAKLPSVL